MAISVTSIVANFNDADQSTDYTTGTVTPTTGTVWVAFLYGARSGATPPDLTLSGMGLTWTNLGTSLPWATDAASIRKLQILKGVGTASAGALTISPGGVAMVGIGYTVIEVTGADNTNPIVSGSVVSNFNNTTATAGTLTYNAAANANNRPIAYWGHSTSEGATFRTNWTELNDVSPASPGTGLETQWRSDTFETTGSATWTTLSKWGVIGGEIAIAATSTEQSALGLLNVG